ncbi:choice-of-anchor D domain-containing protein, partial [bacterium]|nr:choice-of-anchor D domain-containing protein [bacterium]
DDSDENPYTFAIAGTGTSGPEIDLSGNSVGIADGDTTASSSDHTDFGSHDVSTGSQTRTFTITNSGNADLNLTGTTIVTLIGSNASDFEVTTQPDASTVSASGFKTFVVEFDPTAIGLREATVSITSNDADEATYTFAIQGNSTSAGSPLACVANFFQIYGDTGIIAYLDATTDPYTYTTIGTAGYKVNAVGYNIEDGFLYGQARSGSDQGKFLKIDSTGTITILNSITDTFNSVVADFNTSGDLYMFQQSQKKVGILDVSAGAITEHDTTGEELAAKDMAYRHSDGIFYGVKDYDLFAYDPSTHNVTKQTISGILRDDIDSSVSGSTFGAAWTATDDYLYVGNNNSGRMYKINISNLSSVYVGQAIASGSNDGASCSRAPSPLPSTGKIGDKVWVDIDSDGIQDSGEDGLSGVTVSIYEGDDTLLNSDTTDSNGNFLFENLAPSQYYLKITSVPSGYAITSKDSGSDDDVDNDFDPATSKTDLITIGLAVTNNSVDLGLLQVPEINVVGNTQNIADSTSHTPAISDDTDFGSVDTASGSDVHTFTVQNTGTGSLSVGTITIGGTNAGDFTATAALSSTLAGSVSTTFTVTFNPSADGERTATVSIVNGDGNENPYNFNLKGTGTNLNDPPTSTDDSVTTNEDTTVVLADTDFGTYADTDSDVFAGVKITTLESDGSLEHNDGTSWNAVTLNQAISSADIAANKFRFVPDSDEFGTPYATVGFAVYDGTAYSTSSYTLTINVSAVNDPPTSTDDSVTINEDTTVVLADTDFGTYADADSDAFAGVKITTLESDGSLEHNDGTSWNAVTLNQAISSADIAGSKLRFVPDSNENGTPYATVGFAVYDGTAYSTSSYTLTINVSAVNDPPTSSDDSVTTNEDTTVVLVDTDFGTYADTDSDAFAGVKITTLESDGSLEHNDGTSWNAVTLNQAISSADIAGSK